MMGFKMISRSRTIGLSTAICLFITCLTSVPAYASSAYTDKTTNSILLADSATNTGSDSGNGSGSDSDSGSKSASDSSLDQNKDQGTDIAKSNDPSDDTGDSTDQGANKDDDNSQVDDSKDQPTDTTTPSAIEIDGKSDDDESLWYSQKIAMKKEYQKLLWDYCQQRDLDYIDMLALISTESNFNEKCSSGLYKGYFQISKKSGPSLAKTMKTKNDPLNGSININWGTAIYSGILKDKRVKDLEGKKRRDVALSIYQRGTGGYDKRGISYQYLKTYYKKRDIICSYFTSSDDK